MKAWLGLLAFLIGFPLLSPAAGGASQFKEGVDYDRIAPPQPTVEPGKIELREFFWYGCPHCYHFEPDLNAWLKKKPAGVEFVRQPAIFNPRWGAHAKAFFTAEALGVLEKVHGDFYDAIQNKKEALESEEDLAKFFAAHGVADADFRKAYKSFAVDTKMRQAEDMAARYGVTGTPSLIVNGKYRVEPGKAKSFPRMLEIVEELVKREKPGR